MVEERIVSLHERLDIPAIRRTLEDHRSDLDRLGVLALSVFGSVARGEARAESDVDCLVEFADGATLSRYMALKQLLEELFGRRVDLVTRKGLRPRIQPSVEKDAVRVA